MKTFLIDNDTKPKELIEWVNNLSEEWQVFLDSNGWPVKDFYIYRKVLETKDITLRALSVCSSAFDLFYLYEWKKTIEDECFAVIHAKATKQSVFKEKTLKLRASKTQKQSIDEDPPQIRYWILTKKEMKDYLNWEDIYIWTKRLKEYFANTKKSL
jgi:hypothetical protein